MRSLTLFSPTFTRIHQMLQNVQRIKDKTLIQTKSRFIMQICGRVFLVANAIQRSATDVQSKIVEQELEHVQLFLKSRNLRINYDYNRKGFLFEPQSSSQNAHPWMHVRSCSIENYDHPSLRNSLYFHELKDLQKYFKINYPKNCPKFVKDIMRKNAQNQLLDSRNPLGLPLTASPLFFLLNFKNKFLAQYQCRFGNINLRTIRILGDEFNSDGQKKCIYVLLGMNIPRQIQTALNDYCKEQILLNEPELLLFHRLSHIGGRIQQLEDLLNIYDVFRANLDSLI